MSDSAAESSNGDGQGVLHSTLPRGRHHLTREEVTENQRQRLLAAMAESVAIRGYAATSVGHVIELAGVSRATFYKQFENRRDCLLIAHEASFGRFMGEVAAACASDAAWGARAAAAIRAAVGFAVSRPAEARLLALDTIAADAEAAQRAIAGTERLAAMLREGRAHHRRAVDMPEVTEQALVGAVAAILNSRLLSGQSLDGLEPQLVQLVLTPYLGPAAAARRAVKSGGRLGGEIPAVDT